MNVKPKYLSIKELAENNSFLTEAGVRALIYKGDHNGLNESGALVKLGKRILINEEMFFKWIETKNIKYQAEMLRKAGAADQTN